MLKKSIKIIVLLLILVAGCSCAKESRRYDDSATEKNTIFNDANIKDDMNDEGIMDADSGGKTLSALLDWKDIKIVDIGFYPGFAEGTIAQNNKYIFYPNEGNKIIKIEKKTGEKKCIFELNHVKKDTGLQLCLAKDKLIVEYEGVIYRVSFDGNHVEKIVTDSKEKIAALIGDVSEKEDGMIQGIQFYRGDLYLFLSDFYIVRLNLKKGTFKVMAKDVESACFYKNAQNGYYDCIMVDNDQIYYTYYKKGEYHPFIGIMIIQRIKRYLLFSNPAKNFE